MAIRITTFEFPEPAGQYQRSGDSAALVLELAGDYERYHAFLKHEVAAIGRRPTPEQFASGQEYFEACERLHDLVRGEVILRACRRSVKRGRRLDEPFDPAQPLVRVAPGPARRDSIELLAEQD
jgi:hypothetical protein